MALFLFEDFWEEGGWLSFGVYREWHFQSADSQMGGTELGCGFAGNFVAAFIAQAIAWENRLNLFY